MSCVVVGFSSGQSHMSDVIESPVANNHGNRRTCRVVRAVMFYSNMFSFFLFFFDLFVLCFFLVTFSLFHSFFFFFLFSLFIFSLFLFFDFPFCLFLFRTQKSGKNNVEKFPVLTMISIVKLRFLGLDRQGRKGLAMALFKVTPLSCFSFFFFLHVSIFLRKNCFFFFFLM